MVYYKPSGILTSVIGITSIIIMSLSYKFFAKKWVMNLRETGVVINFKTLCKNVGLALTVAASAFGLAFLANGNSIEKLKRTVGNV